jgi:hypothetical protein
MVDMLTINKVKQRMWFRFRIERFL